jgi:hypothetical protein
MIKSEKDRKRDRVASDEAIPQKLAYTNLQPTDVKKAPSNWQRPCNKEVRLKTRAPQVIDFTYARMVE